jgi:hypothetical protein
VPRTVADYRVDGLLREGVAPTQHDGVALPESMHPEGPAVSPLQLDDALTEQPAVGLRD